jgi:hypothetical protein
MSEKPHIAILRKQFADKPARLKEILAREQALEDELTVKTPLGAADVLLLVLVSPVLFGFWLALVAWRFILLCRRSL